MNTIYAYRYSIVCCIKYYISWNKIHTTYFYIECFPVTPKRFTNTQPLEQGLATNLLFSLKDRGALNNDMLHRHLHP